MKTLNLMIAGLSTMAMTLQASTPSPETTIPKQPKCYIGEVVLDVRRPEYTVWTEIYEDELFSIDGCPCVYINKDFYPVLSLKPLDIKIK